VQNYGHNNYKAYFITHIYSAHDALLDPMPGAPWKAPDNPRKHDYYVLQEAATRQYFTSSHQPNPAQPTRFHTLNPICLEKYAFPKDGGVLKGPSTVLFEHGYKFGWWKCPDALKDA